MRDTTGAGALQSCAWPRVEMARAMRCAAEVGEVGRQARAPTRADGPVAAEAQQGVGAPALRRRVGVLRPARPVSRPFVVRLDCARIAERRCQNVWCWSTTS